MNALGFCDWMTGYLDRELGTTRLLPVEVAVVKRKLEAALEHPKPDGSEVCAYHFCVFLHAIMEGGIHPEVLTTQRMLAACSAEVAKKEVPVHRERAVQPSYEGMTLEERVAATGLFKGSSDE